MKMRNSYAESNRMYIIYMVIILGTTQVRDDSIVFALKKTYNGNGINSKIKDLAVEDV